MLKHKNIAAVIFLGVFSMLLLHRVVPHLHHQHQETHHSSAHNYTEHHHHDDHNHNHHQKEKEHKTTKGFIDWFLGTHSHTNAPTDILVLRNTTIQKFTVAKEVAKDSSFEIATSILYQTGASQRQWYHPPDHLYQTYFYSSTLRGPPVLG